MANKHRSVQSRMRSRRERNIETSVEKDPPNTQRNSGDRPESMPTGPMSIERPMNEPEPDERIDPCDKICPLCNGKGTVAGKECENCGGAGRVSV